MASFILRTSVQAVVEGLVAGGPGAGRALASRLALVAAQRPACTPPSSPGETGKEGGLTGWKEEEEAKEGAGYPHRSFRLANGTKQRPTRFHR